MLRTASVTKQCIFKKKISHGSHLLKACVGNGQQKRVVKCSLFLQVICSLVKGLTFQLSHVAPCSLTRSV